MQYSVHSPSRYIYAHSNQLLPSWPHPILSVLIVLQRCQFALLDRTVETENGKQQLRREFLEFGTRIAVRLTAMNYLVELFDPRTGLPTRSLPGQLRLDDVAVIHSLLGYTRMNSGGCAIVLHPVWGDAMYPAILVSSAPPDVLEQVVMAIDRPTAEMPLS